MRPKSLLRLALVLGILTLAARPAFGQFRPFIYEYYPIFPTYQYPTTGFTGGFGGMGYGGYGGYGYGGYGGSYGTFSSGVYTPFLYGYSGYNYGTAAVIVPGFGASGDSMRGRSDLAPAVAVAADSSLLLAAWDQPTGDSRAAVVFVVPNARANIWVEGILTRQTGAIRRFVTPPLAAQKLYEYDVRAQWLDAAGQWQTQSQTVQVRAGAVVNVIFASAVAQASR